MYLVIVDAHSKWLDVHIMPNITSARTIEKLRIVFATHGLPRKVVTDNGPSFTSEEFQSFMSANGITHITTAPYHPSSNGLAERAVQTFKRGLKCTTGDSIQERLSKFLFTYRITPHTTTGISPAELLMGRRPRSRFDRLFPDMQKHVQQKQNKQAVHHDNSKSLRKFAVGDLVYTRDFSTPAVTWTPGSVVKVTGPLSYHIELADGRTVRRHVDAIRKRHTVLVNGPPPANDLMDDIYLPSANNPSESPTSNVPPRVPPPRVPPPARRSSRNRLPPDRYGHGT